MPLIFNVLWRLILWFYWILTVLYYVIAMLFEIICVLWSIPLIWIPVVSVILSYYVYCTWNFSLFSAQGIPGPNPWPVFGTSFPVFTKGLLHCDKIWTETYGDVVGTFEGRIPTLIISNPEMIKHIMCHNFNSFQTRRSAGLNEAPFRSSITEVHGDHWKRIRGLISPAFSPSKLKLMLGHINDCARIMVDNFSSQVEKNRDINIKECTGSYAIDVIARTAFNVETNAMQDKNNLFVYNAKKFFNVASVTNPVALLLFMFPFTLNILKRLKITIMPRDAITFFTDIIDDIIHTRKEAKNKQRDFLQLLLDAESDEGKLTPRTNQDNIFSKVKPVLNPENDTSCHYKIGSVSESDKENIQYTSIESEHVSTITVKSILNNGFSFNESDQPLYFDRVKNLSIWSSTKYNDPELKHSNFCKSSKPTVSIEKDHKQHSSCYNVRHRLTVEEIHAQSLIFFVAGYETTASSLSFLAYALATNQQCQDKLFEEVDKICKEKKDVKYDDIHNMTYLDMCVSECLRLYPPAVRTNRVCCQDTKIGNIIIQRGMLVAIPIYAIHTNPDLWPNPFKFIPERFSIEGKKNHFQYSYLPFGAGPRHCIGQRLALLEIKVALVHILLNYRLQLSSQTRLPLQFKRGGLLQTTKDIVLELQPRGHE